MTATINYPAAELVEGGRTYEQAGCTVLGDDYDLAAAGAVALTAIGCGPTLRWAVVDVAAGNVVLAEATSPADLLPWLTEYAAAIETAEWAAGL